jgi:uncharacterized SAM-binding protein YcdF (DUF218 family)
MGCDVIVVLGARILSDGRCGPAACRRVEAGARAFERGVAPVVIVTGGRRWDGHMEALSMGRLLSRLGVPEGAIVLEPFALSTSENAYFSVRLGRLRGWRRILVVTCPWHMRRAVQDFRLCGAEVIPMPAASGSGAIGRRGFRSIKERTSMWLDALRLRKGTSW